MSFGYRLEVTYNFKEDPKCQKEPSQWTLAERADCLIDDTERFVAPLSPFGTVVATGALALMPLVPRYQKENASYPPATRSGPRAP